MNRSQYLAAATIFSGGAGGILAYTTPESDIPVLAIHGGRSDVFGGGLDFSQMTEELGRALIADGHFMIICDHGGGHRIPFSPGAFALPFLFEHAFGDPESPYASGLGDEWPGFCAIQ